jgi:hypothetical protein
MTKLWTAVELSDRIVRECQDFDNKTQKFKRADTYEGERCLDSNDLEKQVRYVHADKYAYTTSKRQFLWWTWESS